MGNAYLHVTGLLPPLGEQRYWVGSDDTAVRQSVGVGLPYRQASWSPYEVEPFRPVRECKYQVNV